MPSLDIISKTTFKEVITSVELVDLNGNGKSNIILTTLNGDVRVYEFHREEKKPLTETCKIGDLPPLAAIGVGDVTAAHWFLVGISTFIIYSLITSIGIWIYKKIKSK